MTPFALLAGLLLVTEVPKDEAIQKELKKFEGTWVMVSGEKEGQKIADEHVKKSKISWKGKECIVITPHQSEEAIKGTVTLDPSKSPKEMNWTRSVGPNAGKGFHAIYEFIGDDEYRVCFAPPGKDRPKEFKTKAATGQMMHHWKRVKE